MEKILVVDDSHSDRHLIRASLEGRPGFKVTVAASGPDALARIELEQMDLVITGLQMPDMDGLQLVTAIRRRFLGFLSF